VKRYDRVAFGAEVDDLELHGKVAVQRLPDRHCDIEATVAEHAVDLHIVGTQDSNLVECTAIECVGVAANSFFVAFHMARFYSFDLAHL
jgi:hypothetical protein